MLFDAQQSYADPEYGAFLEQAALSGSRAWLESLWVAFSPYADADFLTQARIDFHARFWEMFVGNVFLASGFQLLPNSPGAPDIGVLLSDGRRLWIEAVTPGSGVGVDAVEPMSDKGGTRRNGWSSPHAVSRAERSGSSLNVECLSLNCG